MPVMEAVYWFLMQIGVIAGFFTAWPVNAWLIRAGVKEAMHRPAPDMSRRRVRISRLGMARFLVCLSYC